MLLKIKNRLHSTHDDQGGQTLIFIAIVMFALVCFFALVVNVGDRVTAKVELQNAADASVMAGGIWNARGMNMISILNVGMTECLAFIIFFKAFDKTYIATKAAIEANKLAAEAMIAMKSIPYVGPVIAAAGEIWKKCLELVEKTSLKIAEKMNKLMKKLTKKDKGLWKVMKVLQQFERGVKISAPIIAAYEANRIAELNGADPLLKVPAPVNFTFTAILFPADPVSGLPVKKGVFKDLCPPTTKGGPGYKNFLCWDSALGMKIPIIPMKVRTAFSLAWTAGFL
ncbi:MAG: Tad domain-containing protein [Deltaproteobacteria bacterium]|nr:Tad domain-containing protein [Deltaproteobacteria bacterium]MBW2562998.1 Tad domain-containing protein [Deltaproteobacteria bacterium]